MKILPMHKRVLQIRKLLHDFPEKIIELNNTLITLEPLVYSPLEFETMKKEKRDFILTIEEEGIEIYDDRSTKMV